jgi:hypothetical protein
VSEFNVVSRLSGPWGKEVGKERGEGGGGGGGGGRADGHVCVVRATKAAAATARGRGRYGALQYGLANAIAAALDETACTERTERKEEGEKEPLHPTNA